MKLNAAQLRAGNLKLKTQKSKLKKNEIYIVLDNVLDTYNIGSIFRLADAVAAKKIYLCGGTETPPNHRIKKASINTTEVVEWEYCETALEAIVKLTSETIHLEGEENARFAARRAITPSRCQAGGVRLQVVAIEQSKKSVQYNTFDYKLPICLIVGNETTGVSKEVLQSRMLDGIVEIPMFGVNVSLNVMVSLGIVLYEMIEKTKA